MELNSILLAHGEGGLATRRLINDVFMSLLSNAFLERCEDAAVFTVGDEKLAFTTDAFIVEPVFFPGGDIGKLAVAGTVNDLASMGAKPLFISAAFIIEEGFSIEALHRITTSFSDWMRRVGAEMIAADTKVVPKGSGGDIFICVAGLGKVLVDVGVDRVKPGDVVVISGDIARHSAAVLAAREGLETDPPLLSDCAPLWDIVHAAVDAGVEIHAMRDPTRGGLATTLVEIAEKAGVSITVEEASIPINPQVASLCDIYGYDPLYLANEGKMTFFIPPRDSDTLLSVLRGFENGGDSAVIGEVNEGEGVFIRTRTGGRRRLIMLEGAQLPRIC